MRVTAPHCPAAIAGVLGNQKVIAAFLMETWGVGNNCSGLVHHRAGESCSDNLGIDLAGHEQGDLEGHKYQEATSQFLWSPSSHRHPPRRFSYRLAGIAEDITERKQAGDTARRSSSRNTGAEYLNSASIPILFKR